MSIGRNGKAKCDGACMGSLAVLATDATWVPSGARRVLYTCADGHCKSPDPADVEHWIVHGSWTLDTPGVDPRV